MSGDNGKGTTFYQDEQVPVYTGHDNRTNAGLRMVIDKINDLQDDVKQFKACKDDCNLGELQPHMGHIIDVIKEKGGKDVGQGVTNFRDQDKEVEKILNTRSKVIERAILIIATISVYYVAGKMGWV